MRQRPHSLRFPEQYRLGIRTQAICGWGDFNRRCRSQSRKHDQCVLFENISPMHFHSKRDCRFPYSIKVQQFLLESPQISACIETMHSYLTQKVKNSRLIQCLGYVHQKFRSSWTQDTRGDVVCKIVSTQCHQFDSTANPLPPCDQRLTAASLLFLLGLFLSLQRLCLCSCRLLDGLLRWYRTMAGVVVSADSPYKLDEELCLRHTKVR